VNLQATVPIHMPVLLEEAIEALRVQPGGRYVDCTVGLGGHAAAILERSFPGGQLLGIDADPEAIRITRTRLRPYGSSLVLVNENFAHLECICSRYDFRPVHGILFDLGVSSYQLEASDRGFSFQRDALLDMRYNPGQQLSAADIVNNAPEAELADIIWQYGEERFSRQIARHIVAHRPVTRSLELAQLVAQAVKTRGRIHPATRTFQALRIAVNSELQNLRAALGGVPKLLGHGGRLVVISYHSLEDRIVKEFIGRESKGCLCPPGIPQCICGHRPSLRPVTRKVITPSPAEIEANPRSRSARMRVAEHI